MQKPKSVLENETHKILSEVEIQIDQLISASRPELVTVNKRKNLPNCGFCVPGGPQREKS